MSMKKEVEIVQTFSHMIIVEVPDNLKEPLTDDDIKEIVYQLYQSDEFDIEHENSYADTEMYVEDVTDKKRTDYADVYLDADKVIETMKEMDWDIE